MFDHFPPPARTLVSKVQQQFLGVFFLLSFPYKFKSIFYVIFLFLFLNYLECVFQILQMCQKATLYFISFHSYNNPWIWIKPIMKKRKPIFISVRIETALEINLDHRCGIGMIFLWILFFHQFNRFHYWVNLASNPCNTL